MVGWLVGLSVIGRLFGMFVYFACSGSHWSSWSVVWLEGSNLEEIMRGWPWSIYPFEETQ